MSLPPETRVTSITLWTFPPDFNLAWPKYHKCIKLAIKPFFPCSSESVSKSQDGDSECRNDIDKWGFGDNTKVGWWWHALNLKVVRIQMEMFADFKSYTVLCPHYPGENHKIHKLKEPTNNPIVFSGLPDYYFWNAFLLGKAPWCRLWLIADIADVWVSTGFLLSLSTSIDITLFHELFHEVCLVLLPSSQLSQHLTPRLCPIHANTMAEVIDYFISTISFSFAIFSHPLCITLRAKLPLHGAVTGDRHPDICMTAATVNTRINIMPCHINIPDCVTHLSKEKHGTRFQTVPSCV